MELIETFSIKEILLFIIAFALAVKGFVSFYDWGNERLKKHFKREQKEEDKMDSIQDQIDDHKEEYVVLKRNQDNFKENLKDIIKKVNLLIDSDKDDIKSYITEKHHYFCYEKEWIDDYSLDCIEKRFKHYEEEGGNSFIRELMEELRELPKQPPLVLDEIEIKK